MSTLVNRLDMHFAALAAVGTLAVVGGVHKAEAAVVYSGPLNIAIPNTIDGLYINLVTGAATTPSSTPGYDLNPYVAGGNWRNFGPSSDIGAASVISSLTAGTLIDASGAYIAQGSGTGFAAAFGTTAILGIRFVRESDSATLFGWVRLTLPGSPAATAAGTLVDYAYEDTGAGINAGATTPAPTAGMAVLALGGVGMLARRRKN